MAVPTIASVDPTSGPTKGQNLVRIYGTDFRLPPAPPDGYLGGEQQKTVSVQFEGQESEWAYAASDAMIFAKVPEWRGAYTGVSFPLALDIRVANLDDAGAEIAGENVTLADCYQIYRPSMVTESYLQRVCRELIRVFRRHLLENTHTSTKTIYDDDTADGKARLMEEAPVIHLIGPRTPINRFYSVNREEPEEDETDPNLWLRKEAPVTVDLNFDVFIWTAGESSTRQLLALHNGLLTLFRDVVDLRVDNDPSDPSKGYKEYEMALPWESYPEDDTGANDSDLCKSMAGIEIRGVHLIDDPATILERGSIITANDGEPIIEESAF